MSKYHYNLIKWNLDKYDWSPLEYNKFQVFLLMLNANTHFVSIFKDHLIYDDMTEFFKQYYKKNEIYNRLKPIFEFYESSSYLFPNYTALNEGKYIYKNIIKKQKLIDYLERLKDIKEEKDKGKKKQLYNNNLKNNQQNNNNSFIDVFDTIVYKNIIEETGNDSRINDIFCVKTKKSENCDSVNSLLKLTEQMHCKTEREKNGVKIYVSRHAIKRELIKTKANLTMRNERYNNDLNKENVNFVNNFKSQNNSKILSINSPNNIKDKINNNIVINYNNQKINNFYIENNLINNKKYIAIKTEPNKNENNKIYRNINKKLNQNNKTVKKILTKKKLEINIPKNLKFLKHQRVNTDLLSTYNKIKSPINSQLKNDLKNKTLYKSKIITSYTKSINRNILKNIKLANSNNQYQEISLLKNKRKHFPTNSYNLPYNTAFSDENRIQIIHNKFNDKRKISSKDKIELFTKKIQSIKNRKTVFTSTMGTFIASKKLTNENLNNNSSNRINKSNHIKNKSQGIKC